MPEWNTTLLSHTISALTSLQHHVLLFNGHFLFLYLDYRYMVSGTGSWHPDCGTLNLLSPLVSLYCTSSLNHPFRYLPYLTDLSVLKLGPTEMLENNSSIAGLMGRNRGHVTCVG